jgi:hypothetical protein
MSPAYLAAYLPPFRAYRGFLRKKVAYRAYRPFPVLL